MLSGNLCLPLGTYLVSLSTLCVCSTGSLRLSLVWMAALASKTEHISLAQPSPEREALQMLLPFGVLSEFETADASVVKVKCRNLSF